jgi:hypothetical protein
MLQTILDKRRRQLGITIRALSRMSGVPVATVNRILADPSKVRFEHVAAVSRILGVNLLTAKHVPVKRILHDRACAKARYVAKFVQGTQGLEAAAVDPAGYERLVEVTTRALLAGKRRKLWDED